MRRGRLMVGLFFVSCLIFSSNHSDLNKIEIDNQDKVKISDVRIISNCEINNAIVYYVVDSASNVEIKIYDLDGRIVDVLVNEHKEPGHYSSVWYFKNRSACTYFCQVTCNSQFVNCSSIAMIR